MTTLTEFIEEKVKLPSPPGIAMNILTAVSQEETTFEDLAEIIKVDPSLTARILKIANSSLYGIPKKVESLQQATSLLGIKALQSIALSFVFVESFQESGQGDFSLHNFWQRSVTTAVAAELLAQRAKLSNQEIFITALLQNLGELVLCISDPTLYKRVLDEQRVNRQDVCEAEKTVFGFDHTEVGSYIFDSWSLPDAICLPIRYHHTPKESPQPHFEKAAILGHAERLTSIYHEPQGSRAAIGFRRDLQRDYQLDEDESIKLIDKIGETSREMMTMFSLNPGEVKPLSQLMQEANDELHHLNLSYEQVVLELKQAKASADRLAEELKMANEKLSELAFRDDLTGLYNHRYFQEMISYEIERAKRYERPLSLLFLDIDFFKSVNDTYGHPVGDHVLRETSKKIVELVRTNDIVARYGGEEFAIILPETGESGAKVLAQRIRRGIEQNIISVGNKEINITASIGLASSDMQEAELTRTLLIARSDSALYKAKENGRNKVEW